MPAKKVDKSTMSDSKNKKKILVVDDDVDFLESLQLMLMMDGHNVLSATNGHNAVEQYRQFCPDIVFLDVRMPGLDGYETLMHLKKYDRDARIILTSSYMLDNTKYEQIKKGTQTGLVNKPISNDTLKKMIRTYAK